jgi:hypothetical protein
MRYCAHGPLALMALAWPKLHGPAKLALRPGLRPKHGRSSHGAPAAVAVDSGRWRHGEAGKPVGDHRDGVGARFEGSGRRGAHRSSAPHGGAVGGGGSPVRGHRRGRGRSLHGHRGAPGQGGARGGEGEAIPWLEVPVGVEALSAATVVRRRAEPGERGTRRRNRDASL